MIINLKLSGLKFIGREFIGLELQSIFQNLSTQNLTVYDLTVYKTDNGTLLGLNVEFIHTQDRYTFIKENCLLVYWCWEKYVAGVNHCLVVAFDSQQRKVLFEAS